MCHAGSVPASSIKAMSGEAIYIALTSGAMKAQAEGMSTPQIFTLLGFIAPTGIAGEPPVLTRTCKTAAPWIGRFKTAMNAPRWNSVVRVSREWSGLENAISCNREAFTGVTLLVTIQHGLSDPLRSLGLALSRVQLKGGLKAPRSGAGV